MAEAGLREWSGAVDVRPLLKEDTFQSSPFKYAVNNNRQLYTGMDGKEVIIKNLAELVAVAVVEFGIDSGIADEIEEIVER